MSSVSRGQAVKLEFTERKAEGRVSVQSQLEGSLFGFAPALREENKPLSLV